MSLIHCSEMIECENTTIGIDKNVWNESHELLPKPFKAKF